MPLIYRWIYIFFYNAAQNVVLNGLKNISTIFALELSILPCGYTSAQIWIYYYLCLLYILLKRRYVLYFLAVGTTYLNFWHYFSNNFFFKKCEILPLSDTDDVPLFKRFKGKLYTILDNFVRNLKRKNYI